MRCNNCGWENPDTNSVCEKCNSPLSSGGFGPQQLSSQPAHLNKTVTEAAAFSLPSSHQAEENACPTCGYPMRAGIEICPNCGHGNTLREPQLGGDKQRPIQQHNPQGFQKGGTVNPWVHVAPAAKCTLTPIKQDSETETPPSHEFKGDCHELNRANLDEENLTITSKVQARLIYNDEKWYLEDASSQKTTFVHVGCKMEIHDGDVILMGNRQFIFHSK